MIHELFPTEYVELQKELMTGFHPKLESILAAHAVDDIDMKLAQIASYCGIVLDGTYTLEDRIKLCRILRERLILLRENPNKGIILIN